MKNSSLIFVFSFLLMWQPVYANETTPCASKPWLLRKMCLRLHQIWYEGSNELYLPFYAWHNRFMYTEEKLRTTHYNENAWGGGMGKGFYDEDGDWHGLYAMAFLDSHKHVQPVAGYAFLKTLQLSPNARIGGGYSVLVTMRPDIFDGYPFPGAAPWIGLTYKQVSLSAAYVPGGTNIGNVLFVFARLTFDKA
ncbi:lipid IV(A) palmitoyltransferase PagP [Legionella rubrilucens]|nr:lipid IV(A) palmitoyltransferase PagP [Legionella rubrilucens]